MTLCSNRSSRSQNLCLSVSKCYFRVLNQRATREQLERDQSHTVRASKYCVLFSKMLIFCCGSLFIFTEDIMNITIFPSIVFELRLPNGPCLIPLDNNCINTPSSNPRRVGLGEAGIIPRLGLTSPAKNSLYVS